MEIDLRSYRSHNAHNGIWFGFSKGSFWFVAHINGKKIINLHHVKGE